MIQRCIEAHATLTQIVSLRLLGKLLDPILMTRHLVLGAGENLTYASPMQHTQRIRRTEPRRRDDVPGNRTCRRRA